MSLFPSDSYVLASGRPATWKIEADVLTLNDWRTLSRLVHESGLKFSTVEGVPRGGPIWAQCLQQYATPGHGLLIVDDVLTTGRSMERHRRGREAQGLVAFSRCVNPPDWIKYILNMNPEFIGVV